MLRAEIEFGAPQNKPSPKAFFKLTVQNGQLSLAASLPLSWVLIILSTLSCPLWIEILKFLMRIWLGK